MNAEEQLSDNLKTAAGATAGSLTDSEAAAIEAVSAVFKEAYKIPCTGCNYCLPCPKSVNIPGIFAAYNTSYANGFITGMVQYVTGTGAHSPEKGYTARRCVKCGKCASHCPQHIAIPQELATATKRLEPFWFKAALKFLNRMQKADKRGTAPK
jgi:predicted aldo/keto reductase-like oxidoreductase